MSIFKKKTKLERLQLKYQKLLQQSKNLSFSNQQAGAEKFIEAQIVMDEIVSQYPFK